MNIYFQSKNKFIIAIIVALAAAIAIFLLTSQNYPDGRLNSTSNSSAKSNDLNEVSLGSDGVSFLLPNSYTSYPCNLLQARYIYDAGADSLLATHSESCAYILPKEILENEVPDVAADTTIKSEQFNRVADSAIAIITYNSNKFKSLTTYEYIKREVESKFHPSTSSADGIFNSSITTAGDRKLLSVCYSQEYFTESDRQPPCWHYLADTKRVIEVQTDRIEDPILIGIIESLNPIEKNIDYNLP